MSQTVLAALQTAGPISVREKNLHGKALHIFIEDITIAKFEIMDGAPVHGESVPVRFFLGGFPLTPTYHEGIKVFSVRYYLNLVLVDEEELQVSKSGHSGGRLSPQEPPELD